MKEPIRILCVFGSLDRGGAETMCMNLYRHIDRTKVQFDFVKHTDKACAFDEEIKSLGGRIYSAPRSGAFTPNNGSIAWATGSTWAERGADRRRR